MGDRIIEQMTRATNYKDLNNLKIKKYANNNDVAKSTE